MYNLFSSNIMYFSVALSIVI